VRPRVKSRDNIYADFPFLALGVGWLSSHCRPGETLRCTSPVSVTSIFSDELISEVGCWFGLENKAPH